MWNVSQILTSISNKSNVYFKFLKCILPHISLNTCLVLEEFKEYRSLSFPEFWTHWQIGQKNRQVEKPNISFINGKAVLEMWLMPKPNIETQNQTDVAISSLTALAWVRALTEGFKFNPLELEAWRWDRAEHSLETAYPKGDREEGAGIFCQDPL